MLVAYTDGISEAMNAADEEWGEDRLMEAVLSNRAVPARDLIDRLMMRPMSSSPTHRSTTT